VPEYAPLLQSRAIQLLGTLESSDISLVILLSTGTWLITIECDYLFNFLRLRGLRKVSLIYTMGSLTELVLTQANIDNGEVEGLTPNDAERLKNDEIEIIFVKSYRHNIIGDFEVLKTIPFKNGNTYYFFREVGSK
jgi:hypothetical protein